MLIEASLELPPRQLPRDRPCPQTPDAETGLPPAALDALLGSEGLSRRLHGRNKEKIMPE